MYSWRILIDHEYESDGRVDTNFILNDTVFLAVSLCRETHYLWQYLLNVVKFDTGFNYYARFARPCFIRSSFPPYQYAEFHQLPNVQCNSASDRRKMPKRFAERSYISGRIHFLSVRASCNDFTRLLNLLEHCAKKFETTVFVMDDILKAS